MRRRWLTWVVMAALAASSSGRAATLCRKKSGAVTYRTSACKKKETALDLAALGVVGPKGDTGAPGDAGGFLASALVAANSTTPVRASNVTAVTHPQTGVYCLTPAAGIDATRPALVTPDLGHSTSASLAAWVENPVFYCDAGTYEVRTVDLGGASSDAVGFVFGVP